MSDQQNRPDPEPKARRRKALPIAIIVVAAVIGLVGVLAIWVKRQALETSTWTETSTQLLENPDIRDAIATFVTDQVYANVDVSGELEDVLPAEFAGLSGPISGALRNLVSNTAQKALESDQFQALWEDANRAAHEQLLRLLDDKGTFVSTTGGVVTLDLGAVVQGVADEVGIGGDLAAKLPPDAAQLTIMDSSELGAAQTGVKVLRTLAWFLAAISIGLFALAIYLARGWRREALRAIGVACVAVGVIVLFLRGAGGNIVVDALTSTAAAKPAVDATWEIGTSLLKDGGQALILYGIVILLAAWLAGPSRPATSIRRGLTPYLRQPVFAYGGLAVVLIILFWWDPIQATHRLLPSLLLIVLLAIGVETLRRQVIGEFPDRVEGWSAQTAAQDLTAKLQGMRDRRGADRAAEQPTASLDRTSELERLAHLHETGVLTDDELANEKTRVLRSLDD